ncbi:MAG: IniB N-terminal domain-containing protein [Actinophytocola sp.]|uniref:IniB N-terminal domain-containing protein n=1 Tax=Actinophytocola sp. TaxID=1872138 RepID=UPI003C74F30B
MTTTISSLIDFLMALLGDEELADEFRADPDGVLEQYGLDSMCGEDIRDAAPMVADQVGVHAVGGQPHFGGDDDPVAEISVITKHYDVTIGPTTNEYNYYYVDDNDIIITVDDRDTITIHSEGDLTITDSFNEDNDITVIEDSFNQDNDGVDNKGGSIDDSVVTGDDMADSVNSDDDATLTGSHNTTVSETGTDLSTDTTVDDSFNDNTSDDDYVDVDVAPEEQAPLAVHDSDDLWPTVDADTGGELDTEALVSE